MKTFDCNNFFPEKRAQRRDFIFRSPGGVWPLRVFFIFLFPGGVWTRMRFYKTRRTFFGPLNASQLESDFGWFCISCRTLHVPIASRRLSSSTILQSRRIFPVSYLLNAPERECGFCISRRKFQSSISWIRLSSNALSQKSDSRMFASESPWKISRPLSSLSQPNVNST